MHTVKKYFCPQTSTAAAEPFNKVKSERSQVQEGCYAMDGKAIMFAHVINGSRRMTRCVERKRAIRRAEAA